MNTPNKLTVARIIMTPIFMVCFLIDFRCHYLLALILFIAASLTDFADGKMARKYNLVTDFGKFLDPLADKMLTTAAYLGFICIYRDNPLYCAIVTAVTFVVLFREFAVSSVRLVVVSSGGKVIAANIFGKIKTASQMVGTAVILAFFAAKDLFKVPKSVSDVADIVIMIFLAFTAVICVISGITYLAGAKEYIDPKK